MDFTMESSFCWPKHEIINILSSGDDPVSMEDLPNISEYKICEFKKTDDGFFKKIEWRVQGEIPSFAKSVIKPDMLRFVEETHWHEKNSTFSTHVIPHFFTNKIHCRLNAKWGSDGNSKSIRSVDVSVKVKIPFIGGKIEGMIAEILKQNNEKYSGLLNKSFTDMLGEPVT